MKPIICLLLISISTLGLAQEVNELESPLIISPNDYDSSSSFYQTDETISGNVTTIDSDEINKRPGNVLNVIDGVSGIKFEESVIDSFLSIRGSKTNQVQILINGLQVRNLNSALTFISTVPKNAVEKIEVYRSGGPVGVSYLNSGGAINIILKENWSNDGELVFKAGSFGNLGVGGNTSYSGKYRQTQLQFHSERSKNNFEYEYNNGTPNSKDDDIVINRVNADWKKNWLSLNHVEKINRRTRFQIRPKFYTVEKGLPLENVPSLATSREKKELIDSDFVFQMERILPDDGNLEISVGFLSKKNQVSDPDGQIGLTAGQYKTDNEDLSENILMLWNKGKYVFQLSFQNHQESERHNGIQVGKREIRSGGLKLENFVNQYLSTELQIKLVQSKEDNDKLNKFSENSLETGRLGTKVEINQNVSLMAGFEKAGRLPTMYEVFGDGSFQLSSLQLGPESSSNIEGSVLLEKKILGIENKLILTVFKKEIDQLIVSTYDAFGQSKSINGTSSEITGQEIEYLARWNGLKFSHHSYFSRPRLKTSFGDKITPGVPEREWRNNLSYSWSNVEVGVEHNFKSPFFLDESNLLLVEGTNIFNFSLGGEIADSKLNLNVNNFTDVRRQDFRGLPARGRNFELTLTQSF